MRFRSRADKLEILDTTFPHDKPQMLFWNVQNEIDGEATSEITCFTSGIHWSADYVLVADLEETNVNFEGFVRLSNNSGEEYENAQVRLVVGKINLVEKIAQLARVRMEEVDKLEKAERDEYRFKALKKVAEAPMPTSAPATAAPPKPKEVIPKKGGGLLTRLLFRLSQSHVGHCGW